MRGIQWGHEVRYCQVGPACSMLKSTQLIVIMTVKVIHRRSQKMLIYPNTWGCLCLRPDTPKCLRSIQNLVFLLVHLASLISLCLGVSNFCVWEWLLQITIGKTKWEKHLTMRKTIWEKKKKKAIGNRNSAPASDTDHLFRWILYFFIQVVHDSQKQMAHFTSLNDFKDVEIYSKGF